jgi:hypothetical protein
VSALDRFLGACSAADPSDLSRLLAVSSEIPLAAEYEQLLPEFATTSPPAVRALLAAGVPVDSRGHYGGTALHWACWKGYAGPGGRRTSGPARRFTARCRGVTYVFVGLRASCGFGQLINGMCAC